MIKVLFICMGNICRSPTAEGAFRALVLREGLGAEFEVDSAGTHAYHVGSSPDLRAQEAALRRGTDLSMLRARRVSASDFEYYDYILAMDRENMNALLDICPRNQRRKLRLLLDCTGTRNRDVPDPYYGGPAGFERVLDLVEEGARALLNEIRRRHRLPGTPTPAPTAHRLLYGRRLN